MRKTVLSIVALGLLSTSAYSVDCQALMEQYHAPDPSIKTMKQLKRWVKRKVKDGNKKALQECLISQAADNPNKATVAGQ